MSPGAVDHVALLSTPVVAADLDGAEAINTELRTLLLAETQSSPGLRRSNVGGWHSQSDLHNRPELCYRAVMDAIVGRVGELIARLAAAKGAGPVPRYHYGLEAWAMVMRRGDYAVLHDHGDAHFSSVYWVDPGDDVPDHPESGFVVLVDPRRGVRPIPELELFSPLSSIKPHAGSFIVFPGWLQHYVHSYWGRAPSHQYLLQRAARAPAPVRRIAETGVLGVTWASGGRTEVTHQTRWDALPARGLRAASARPATVPA